MKLDNGSARKTPSAPRPNRWGRIKVKGTTITIFRNSEKKTACLAKFKPVKVVWPQFWPVLWELQFHKFFHLRGVAHLVERLVWDQEARSSSLRTSTKKRPFLRLKTLENGRFFIILHNFLFCRKFWPQFDQYRTGQNLEKFSIPYVFWICNFKSCLLNIFW